MLNKGTCLSSCRRESYDDKCKAGTFIILDWLRKNGLSYGDCNFEGLQILSMPVSFMQNKICNEKSKHVNIKVC